MNKLSMLLGAAMIVAAPFVNRSFCALAMDEADIYAPTRQAPVVVDTPFVHDPVMAYEDGVYYLYCTGHGITQMTSTDRQHWTLSREGVLPNGKIPAWTHDSVPGFETHIWAPDVVKYRGKWYMAILALPLARILLPSDCSATSVSLTKMDGRMRVASWLLVAIGTTGMPSIPTSSSTRRENLG